MNYLVPRKISIEIKISAWRPINMQITIEMTLAHHLNCQRAPELHPTKCNMSAYFWPDEPSSSLCRALRVSPIMPTIQYYRAKSSRNLSSHLSRKFTKWGLGNMANAKCSLQFHWQDLLRVFKVQRTGGNQ
jgi:hypothetical protein